MLCAPASTARAALTSPMLMTTARSQAGRRWHRSNSEEGNQSWSPSSFTEGLRKAGEITVHSTAPAYPAADNPQLIVPALITSSQNPSSLHTAAIGRARVGSILAICTVYTLLYIIGTPAATPWKNGIQRVLAGHPAPLGNKGLLW